MTTGAKISGIAHLAFILLALLGGLPWWSGRERDAVQVSEVSFVSPEEFERAASGAREPPQSDAPPEPEAPAEPEVASSAAPEAPDVEVVRPRPAPAPEPVPEPEPEPEAVATLAPEFDPESPLGLDPPEASPSPRIVSVNPAPLTAVAPPQPRRVVRIEPDPAPPPPEAAAPAPEPQPATAASPEPPRPVEERRQAAAPPEAAPEPATEAPPAVEPEPVPESIALATSIRPRARPERLAARAAPEPAPEPVREAAAEPEPTRTAAATPPSQPSATAPTAPSVTEPTQATAPAASSLPVGPPITLAEKDGLKFAIQRCWNVPAGLRNAEELKITVAAELAADGALIADSVRLIEPASVSDARYEAAYRAARSALIRCAPYDALPREKYGQWRNLEVVFNPEGMVSW